MGISRKEYEEAHAFIAEMRSMWARQRQLYDLAGIPGHLAVEGGNVLEKRTSFVQIEDSPLLRQLITQINLGDREITQYYNPRIIFESNPDNFQPGSLIISVVVDSKVESGGKRSTKRLVPLSLLIDKHSIFSSPKFTAEFNLMVRLLGGELPTD